MKCISCKSKEAVVHYAEIINGKMKKMDLCEDCAMEKGVGINLSFSVGDLLAGLTDVEQTPTEKARESVSSKECAGCGLTHKQFKATGRLGCSRCYNSFERQIRPILETVHKGMVHVGKVPVRAQAGIDHSARIAFLEKELEKTIAREEYEEAARIRDEIRRLHNAVTAAGEQSAPPTAEATPKTAPPAKERRRAPRRKPTTDTGEASS